MEIRPPTFRSLEEMIVAAAESVRPPERITVSEAAAKYRKLNNPGSYVGDWKNEKTPYLVEPMDELTSQHYTGMVFVGPARTGKSDMFFNWLLHSARCDPADIMPIDMTKEVAREWSMGDLAKFARNQPDFAERMLPGRQNDDRRQDVQKRRPPAAALAGHHRVFGKTLPRTWTADYDRIDDADRSRQGRSAVRSAAQAHDHLQAVRHVRCEGPPPGRPIKDTKWQQKTKHQAPPTSGILALYNRGDRRRYYWRCPVCKQPFEPDFDLFCYPDSEDAMEAAEMVTMRCPARECQFDIEPSFKQELNVGGRWVKDGMFWMPDGSMQGKQPKTDIASFWLKGPCAAFQDWKSLVFNYIQAKQEYRVQRRRRPAEKDDHRRSGQALRTQGARGDTSAGRT